MLRKKFSTNEKIVVARKLGYLLKGGASLIESFTLVNYEFKSWKSEYFNSVIDSLVQGKSLYRILSERSLLFDPVSLHFIKVGEMTGLLSESFETISINLRKNLTLKRKIQNALLYPLIVMTASGVLIGILLIYVFPKITSIFLSVHMKLPITTEILINLSNFLQKYWMILLATLSFCLICFFFFIRRSTHLKYILQKQILSFRLSKHVFQPLYLKKFCQLFGGLLKNGLSLIEVILIVRESNIAEIYKKHCFDLEQSLLKGKKISSFFKSMPLLFPPMFTSFINAGENSGNLSISFLYLADIYEESAETIITKLSSLIEPLTMIIVGTIIGVIALSIISPIYQLTSSLNIK